MLVKLRGTTRTKLILETAASLGPDADRHRVADAIIRRRQSLRPHRTSLYWLMNKLHNAGKVYLPPVGPRRKKKSRSHPAPSPNGNGNARAANTQTLVDAVRAAAKGRGGAGRGELADAVGAAHPGRWKRSSVEAIVKLLHSRGEIDAPPQPKVPTTDLEGAARIIEATVMPILDAAPVVREAVEVEAAVRVIEEAAPPKKTRLYSLEDFERAVDLHEVVFALK